MKQAFRLGSLNCLSYFLLTWDFRSVSQANIPYSLLVNMVIALLSFTIFKQMMEAKGHLMQIAYAVGGTVGTYLGIICTLYILGK